MKLFGNVLCCIGVAIFALLWLLLAKCAPLTPDGQNAWIHIFFTQARVPMFTGFLTVGSFLLTLQTGIVQRLKDAYDTDKYRDRYKVLKAQNKNANYYGSLRRLSVALSTNVILALTSAAAQMTFGFVQRPWSSALCIALGATTIGLVAFLTVQMFLAHREWFEKIESEQQKKLGNPAAGAK